MRLIARSHLVAFWQRHAEAKASLMTWEQLVKSARWASMSDVTVAFPKAKILNGERVRFAIHHNDYRLIVAFDFPRQTAYVKFLGTHKNYDAIDPFTVAQF